MSDCYLTLEEVKLNTSYLDGSIYKTYITYFFSYTKARHEIRYLYNKDTFNKLGYKAKINTHTTSYIN